MASLFWRDPKRMFGAVCIRGTRVSVCCIKSRFRGGDSVEVLARDYEQPESTIRAAINYNKRTTHDFLSSDRAGK